MLSSILSYWFTTWAITTPVSIAGTSIVYFPLLALYVLGGAWTFRRWPPPWGPVEKAFLVFWLLSVVSAIFGMDARHSTVRLSKDLYFFMTILLGAYLAREPVGPKLLKIFAIAAIVTAALGALQLVIGVNQSDSSGGVFYYLPPWIAYAPRKLLDILSLVNGRARGTRSHPLTYAEGLLFAFAYTLSMLASRRQDWWKWALGQYVILLGLVASQSRGPWIAAVAMVLILCILRRDVLVYKRLALFSLPILLCFLWPTLRKRALSIGDTGYAPNAERFVMWNAGRRMIHDHPLLGIGPGSVPLASPLYQTEQQRLDGPWGHLHDTYINVAAERGLIGLAAFLAFIFILARELWRGYGVATAKNDEDSQIILLTALLGLAGWLVAGFTETVYHDSNVLMVFYFVMGIALAVARGLLKDLKRV